MLQYFPPLYKALKLKPKVELYWHRHSCQQMNVMHETLVFSETVSHGVPLRF